MELLGTQPEIQWKQERHPSLSLPVCNSEMAQANACFSVYHLIGGRLLQLNFFGLGI